MPCEAEDVGTPTVEHNGTAESNGNVADVASTPRLPEDGLAPPHPPQSTWPLAVTLGVCFTVPIAILLATCYWASNRVITVDHAVDRAAESRILKLQLLHQAVRYSNENNIITTRLFLEKNGPSPGTVLARRDQNSGKVTEIVADLDAASDSDRERQLLQAIKETRAPYLANYHLALKVLLQDKDRAKAESLMLGEVMPSLYAYRIAWDELAAFEMAQIKASHEQGEALDLKTRHVALTLIWLAGICCAAIGAFATSRIVADAKARGLMQQELRSLNAMLERRVTERTEQLARAQDLLRDSLNETQAYTREVEAINELAKLLQSCLSLKEAHQLAARVLQRFFAAGSVLLLNSSRNLLDIAFSWGDSATKRGPVSPGSCWALRRGERHLVEPSSVNLLCPHTDDTSPMCHLCVPMIAQGDSLGVLSIDDLSLCDRTTPARAIKRKLRLAETLAEQIALAFANLQLRETLKYQSVRDSLTGLFNRRHMEESLERELLRAARNHTEVAVLMVDIDHFKRFNDMFGHEAGDFLLCELGGVLRFNVRGADIACRYGGDEFLLIMSETSLETGYQRAEAIRKTVTELRVHRNGQTLPKLTLSIGLAGFPVHGETSAGIVNTADQALYRAKHEGRDRVIVAGR